MAKILISDLMGTLIPDTTYILQRFFDEGNCLFDKQDFPINKDISKNHMFHLIDKAFINLGKQLNCFLEDGNYVKIVTSVEGHESADFMFNEFIIRLYESIKKYKNQVSIFFVGKNKCLKTLPKKLTIYEKNGNIYAQDKNGISITILDDKVGVFEFVKKEHNLCSDRLFAIGDSDIDIPMLFKCIDLGGKSSLINNDLYVYTKNETVDSILKQKAIRDVYSTKAEEHKCDILLKEIEKLYKLLGEGKIDLNALIKEREIYEILDSYNRIQLLFNRSNYKEISMERINELDMYPTFNDYCNKVLLYKK